MYDARKSSRAYTTGGKSSKALAGSYGCEIGGGVWSIMDLGISGIVPFVVVASLAIVANYKGTRGRG